MTHSIRAYHDDLVPRPIFVGVFDVLGFKGLIESMPLPRLLDNYRRLVEQKRWAAQIPVLGPRGARQWRIGTTIFSDTILMWCDDNRTALDTFLAAAGVLVAAAIDAKWPLRGGIAYGEAVLSTRDRVFVGRAIVDAYLMEQSQQWVGAAFHPTCLEHATLAHFLTGHDAVTKYPVPTGKIRSRIRTQYAVHWGPYSGAGRKNLEALAAGVRDSKIKRKYRSALRYLERKCRQHAVWNDV